MKVQGPGSTRSVGSTRKSSDTSKVSDGEFARALGEEDEVSATSAVSGTSSINSIDALISAQAISGEQERSQMAKARAEELLERLDALRHGLLEGRLSEEALSGLVDLVSTERAQADDPGLSETLDAIELLAKVELAKLGRDV
jgi:hypothetical protein